MYKIQEKETHDPLKYPAFKKAEKFYRKKNRKFSEFTDLITLHENEQVLAKKGVIISEKMINNKKYKIYSFKFPKGLKIVKNLLTQQE